MTAENQTKLSHTRRNRIISGLVLILLGGLFLVNQIVEIPSVGKLFLPGLGLIFLIWGMITRTGGLLIPGGILIGLGAGIYLSETLGLEGEQEPGVFMLAFGGGFVLITLLSLVFSNEKHWWALIPGGILATIGAALYMGGAALDILEMIGKFWPVILIVMGVWIIFRRR
ncbi:MAG: hypothetical protein HUU38_22230 [Anaerolineales bacterium]|nr:hypothetical protein [Anaerolineales bacterium]